MSIKPTKNMKKVIYALILSLVVAGGIVFANHKIKNETSKKWPPKPLTAAEMKAGRERWEATPDGIMYKKWEASPAGKKVYAAEAKIRKHLRDSTNMEAVITSLSLPGRPICSDRGLARGRRVVLQNGGDCVQRLVRRVDRVRVDGRRVEGCAGRPHVFWCWARLHVPMSLACEQLRSRLLKTSDFR